MKNYGQSVKINHTLNWSYIPDHPYRILIVGGSRSDNTNLVKHQKPDSDKTYSYVKDPFESKYQLLINGKEKVGIEILKILKGSIDYSQTNEDVHENLEDYNPTKKRRVLIVFDDIIGHNESNKKLYPIVTELFLRRKNALFCFFLSQSYFKVPKTIRLNGTHYFITKIPNKRELQQVASNHSPDTDFKDFMKLYKKYTEELDSFLVNDTTYLQIIHYDLRRTYYKNEY